MATSNQGIEKIGELTGMSHNELLHIIRILQRDPAGDKWPVSHPGGRSKSVHLMPAHLVYLAFTLAYGAPADGPEVIETFRAMTPIGKFSVDDSVIRKIRKLTLGQGLEALIDILATVPDTCPDFKVVMHKTRKLQSCFAEIYIITDKQTTIIPYALTDMHKTALEAPLPFDHTGSFGIDYFKVCAELWLDTQNHWAGLKAAAEI